MAHEHALLKHALRYGDEHAPGRTAAERGPAVLRQFYLPGGKLDPRGFGSEGDFGGQVGDVTGLDDVDDRRVVRHPDLEARSEDRPAADDQPLHGAAVEALALPIGAEQPTRVADLHFCVRRLLEPCCRGDVPECLQRAPVSGTDELLSDRHDRAPLPMVEPASGDGLEPGPARDITTAATESRRGARERGTD